MQVFTTLLTACYFETQTFLILYIQTLHNDDSYIEDVHLPFCAHFTTFFLFFGDLELRHFSVKC